MSEYYRIHCECEGCIQAATVPVFNRVTNEITHYCPEHASEGLAKDSPEHEVACPNCGCVFSVN